MNPLITLAIIFGIIVGILIVVCIVAFIQHRLHPNGYDASPKDIRDELQRIIDGKDQYALGDFISIPLKDPRLEAIRQRCARLDEEFPPISKGEYCGPGGIEVIRGFIRELEHEVKDLKVQKISN